MIPKNDELEKTKISILEGTFTPKIGGYTTKGTATYILQEGNYTKIGNVIFYNFRIGCSKLEGSDGYLHITGFPFLIIKEPNIGNLIVNGSIFDDTNSYHSRAYENGFLLEKNSSLGPISGNWDSQHYIYGTGFYFIEQ